MPIRFRQTIPLIPGLLRLNINRRSVSLTLGPRGGPAVTWNSRGTRTASMDLPGPFSWRTMRRRGRG